jgi:peptide/nickel transport system permease protein
VQALILMLFALIYIVLTLIADVLNGWLDPRMRLPSVRND